MKFDLIRTIVGVGIAALLAWGYYAMTGETDSKWPLAIVVGVEIALLGLGMMGLSFPACPRSGVMIRTTCGVAAAVLLIVNAVYAHTGVGPSFYIINGIAMLLVLLCTNGMYKANQ